MKGAEDPRAWLRPHKQQPDNSKCQQASSTATRSNPKHVTHGMQVWGCFIQLALMLHQQLK
jgi:hypothetical protein